MGEKIHISNRHSEIENHKICHINRLGARANLIPALKRGVYYKNKEESELLYSLNGNYRFNYQPGDSIPEFYHLNFDDQNWDVIDVPSMWQFRGYGKCEYTNTNYPFPCDPPYIGKENPVGYYRKMFNYNPKEKTILHFGGVDNAFYVYLNGEFVGFSKGSRNASEFDVTALIKKGENVIAVKVFTYSDASYLENQDMLMANGIFRDVYLLGTDSTYLWDYRVTSDLKGFKVEMEVSRANPEYSLELKIDDKEIKLPCDKNPEVYIPIDEPKLWNAENPNLYDLTITLLKNNTVTEIHSKKIGMMHSEFTQNALLVNGSPVYIKGVNRHEFDCRNGRAISVDLIEKELKMIKENNINSIRCSHYTNHPAFYEICTEIGIYVMDEYDIETHGCSAMGDQGFLSKNEEWLEAFLDRAERALKQNKNETCIYMRSMGNEFGRGENIIKCLEYTMEYDPFHAAIHDQVEEYEDLISGEHGKYDFYLRCAYLSTEALTKVIEKQPLCFQVEYAHVMGNSPGALKRYQDFVYKYDNYIGGFVWEFKNHGIHKLDENGMDYYLHGGDFENEYHWGNFCFDGLIMSDGTPKHSWYELKEVFAPVYIYKKDNSIWFKNTYDFRSSDVLSIDWEICEDYLPIRCGTMQLPYVKPHCDGCIPIDLRIEKPKSGAVYYLNLKFYDGKKLVCRNQIEILKCEASEKYIPDKFNGRISSEKQRIIVAGDTFTIEFENGMISKFEECGKKLIDERMEFNVFRAPTDNDGIMTTGLSEFYRNAGEWKEMCLQSVRFYMEEMDASICDDRVILKVVGKVKPFSLYYGFNTEIIYEIFGNGIVTVLFRCRPYGRWPEKLPRIGVSIPLKKEMDNICWYGRGYNENYSDCKLASPMGLYQKKVSESYTIYDRPQETGNHENTRFLKLTDCNNIGLTVIGLDEFSFSCHDFSLDNLTRATHKNKIVKSLKNYLYIDYKMRGLGSFACGPEPEEEFELRPHSFEFAFLIKGVTENDEALDIARKNFNIKTQALTNEDYCAIEVRTRLL